MKRLFALVALLLVVLSPRIAFAHPTPGSVAFVDIGLDRLRIEQDVPIEELQRAMDRELFTGDAALGVEKYALELRDYAASHVRAEGWSVHVDSVTGHDATDGPRARFLLTMTPMATEPPLVLHDGIVADEVVSHYLTVYVRRDWARGHAATEPRLVGVIHAGRTELVIPRAGGLARGVQKMIGAGIEHIATGTDHVLFLLALLLVAPVDGARWQRRRTSRDALIAVARVVTAFTIGHSLTLALGALALVRLPASLVEAAIAVSILVAAAHAFRPILPRREALTAGLFGLVHGLAFAQTLAERDVSPVQIMWTLVGFNAGIELAQLVLLALVLPWLLVLAQTRVYDRVRVTGAILAGALASGWLLERTTSLANPFARPVAWLEMHPMLLLCLLAAGTVWARHTTSDDSTADAVPVGGHRP
ncbi:MAG: HupE/UreJ family protein [Labilithrix sp.]